MICMRADKDWSSQILEQAWINSHLTDRSMQFRGLRMVKYSTTIENF